MNELTYITEALKRIEENQSKHSENTDKRLSNIETTCAILVTKQKTDDKEITRLRDDVDENKKKLWQVGGAVSFLTASAVAIADKLLGGGT
jgi:polyhydroxyalkanoate synthesis regulator phasin